MEGSPRSLRLSATRTDAESPSSPALLFWQQPGST
ncbi:MAG: hypothetical protein BJ554DRAFT_3465 [Olpidium bornovanus]|uniref:Uncharacterized protein n=1 Tax=Olpidium bornovanus TaxID=278681 RepID=A0A8H8A2Z3_9FUNG|nr:MAG: hypothetical protein BJ554DRAFT_3465 [Olpidium bornovanus]